MQHFNQISEILFKKDVSEFDKYSKHKDSEYAYELFQRIVDVNCHNRASVIEAVTNIDNRFLQDNWGGHINDEIMGDIFNQIQNTEISSLIYRRDFLEKIIEFKIKPDSGVTSVPVPLILELSQTDSNITPVNFEDIKKYKYIVSAFKSMVASYNEMSSSEKTTLMLISTSLFSGVFNDENLLNLSNMSYSDIKNKGDNYWIDIPYRTKKCNHALVRKVYIDNVSLQIIRLNINSKAASNCSGDSWGEGCKKTKEGLAKNIKSMFSAYARINIQPLKNTGNYLNILSTYGSYWLPVHVLNYCSGKNISYSLSRSASERFMFGELISDIQPLNKKVRKQHVSKENKRKIISKVIKITPSYDETDLIENISALIKNDDFSGLKSLLESEQMFSTSLRYITEWCMALRTGSAPERGENKTKSVLDSFKCLSINLPAFINGEDLVSMDINTVTDCYDRILEYEAIEFMESFQLVGDKRKELILIDAKSVKKDNSISSDNESYIDGILNIQASVSKELKTFHQFLVSIYGVDKINFYELDGFLSTRHSVNANIIMPNEYNEILKTIWPSNNVNNRLERIRYIIFILGYRLGMRRMEILQLMMKDISGNKYATIKILSNEYGSLKSTSSKRWIPIHDLLTNEECSILIEWAKLRKNETAGCKEHSLLFTLEPDASNVDSSFDKMLTINSTYDVIHRLMRKVTGDDDVSFHSLRHSFVSWHLLLQEAKRIPSIICDSISSLKYLNEDGFYSRTFKELLNYDDSSSKALYQLSILIGHSTPYITLLHYSHFMDWISYNWMRSAIPMFNKQEMAVLLGVEQSSIYTKLKNINPSDNGEYHIDDCVQLSKKSVLKSI